jgi:hypothetical protein
MGSDWAAMVKAPPPGAPTGPRPRRTPTLTQGYLIYQPIGVQQQPVAAVPYPSNPMQPVQVQQLQGPPYTQMYAVPQQQPVAAVPHPVQPQQQIPAVYSVPKEQQQVAQPTAAVPRSGNLQQQQQPQQQQGVVYPAYQTYQPYPTAAVPKPQQTFVPVVGAAGQRSALPLPGHYSSAAAQLEKPDITATTAAAATASDPATAPASPTVALAFVAAASHAAQDPSFLGDDAPPTVAATTKPYSAPPLMTSLAAAALEKPGVTPAVSSRGRLPRNAPVHINAPAVDSPDQMPVAAAVDKPPFPTDVPRSHWPHVGQPASSSGAPFSLSAPMQRGVAAVLSPELQAALDRHNKYR